MEYGERDAMALGEFYTKHVMAMTEESLHSKAAIAAELAHRDAEIVFKDRTIESLKRQMQVLDRSLEFAEDAWENAVG